MTTPKPKSPARPFDCGTRNGYWECPVVGGCKECRRLARDIEDDQQITDWKIEENEALANALKALTGSVKVTLTEERRDPETGEIVIISVAASS